MNQTQPDFALAIMTFLYHATDRMAAKSIEREQRFRHGKRGFAGPGIYFSRSEEGALRHCWNGRGGGEVIIKCSVDLGRTLEAKKDEATEKICSQRGCGSVRIVHTDTYCIYDPSKVVIKQFRDAVMKTGQWHASMDELVREAWNAFNEGTNSPKTGKSEAKATAKAKPEAKAGKEKQAKANAGKENQPKANAGKGNQTKAKAGKKNCSDRVEKNIRAAPQTKKGSQPAEQPCAARDDRPDDRFATTLRLSERSATPSELRPHYGLSMQPHPTAERCPDFGCCIV